MSDRTVYVLVKNEPGFREKRTEKLTYKLGQLATVANILKNLDVDTLREMAYDEDHEFKTLHDCLVALLVLGILTAKLANREFDLEQWIESEDINQGMKCFDEDDCMSRIGISFHSHDRCAALILAQDEDH